MSKSKLWAFGCSFTHEGAFPGLEEYVWPTRLGERLNVVVRNTGISANSMFGIINQMIDKLSQIEEGDTVVVGTTYPARYTRPTISNGDIVGTNFSHWTGVQVEEAEDAGRSYLKFDTNVSVTSAKAIFSFVIDEVEENNNLYDLHFTNTIKGLFKELKLRGVRVLLWNWRLWSEFEKFKSWDISFDDGHWSPNGHAEASEFFYYCIDNGLENASDSLLRKWRYKRKVKNVNIDYLDFNSNFTREEKTFKKLPN
jgi:hypothetical protein